MRTLARGIGLATLCALPYIVATSPAATAAALGSGPPLLIYRLGISGTASPTTQNDPAKFNAQATILGAATPPSAALTSGASPSTFNGNPGGGVDLTAAGNQPFGTTIVKPCTGFSFANGNGCIASAGSTTSSNNVFVAVQTWPFYVDAAPTSSNLGPGTYLQEVASDDGSWFVLAPAPYTYAQPGNFGGATGLTAGTAVIDDGVLQGVTSTTGSVTIAAQTTGPCSGNLYYWTWEYLEAAGGGASIEYSWQPPGSLVRVQNTQGVVYGQVTRNGVPAGGDAITVSVPGGTTAALTTDANGCYGYNYPPFAMSQSITATATDTTLVQSKTTTTTLGSGNASVVNFAFSSAPQLTLYKRLTQISRGGVSIVPTPDPGNPAGVAGTANYAPGVFPADILTYSIYFLNGGSGTAYGATATTGPQITDPLQSALSYLTGTQTAACCINATTSDTPAFALVGATLQWSLPSPMATYVPSATNAYQGVLTFQAQVK